MGLSRGASSTALVDILNDQLQSQLEKKRPSPTFEPVVVHVDTGLGPHALARHADRYPRMSFQTVPLARALELDTVDWATLPARAGDGDTAEDSLRDLFDRLPSATSRADVSRLLVRHVLVDAALREGCRAVLLGCSTTALAELTLGETAKGRGFSLPWMMGDGPMVVRRFRRGTPVGPSRGDFDGGQLPEDAPRISICYPNRELFRSELLQYSALTEPLLTDLVAPDTSGPSAVVSHKDVSIDEVMTRYFADVEENYPSIVANVVRTTAKLERRDEEDRCCGLCGMGMDELGDERWKGEMGDDGGGEDERLCYGCARAMRN